MSFLRKTIAITRKDVLSEARTREVIFSALVFALLVIVTFNFAFGVGQADVALVAPGILWVTFTFAGVLSLNRAFVQENEDGCLEGLMASPVQREAIYVGKMLGSLLFMFVIEIIAVPVFAVLFDLSVFSGQLVLVTFLATVGFVAVGTLFAALAVNTKARDLVLPILFLPVVMPVVIGAVKASGSALTGGSWGDISSWLEILAAFDVIFLVVSLWVFGSVIEE